MKRVAAFLPLAVLIVLAIVFAGWSLKRDPHVQPHALVGKPVPAVVLPDLDTGARVALSDPSKGPRLINFFASWCAPCEVEHPVLMGLRAQKVRIVGIAYKDAPPNTQGFLNRLGDPFAQILVDRDGRAGVEFGVTGVPETYVVGRDGMILAKHTGPLTPAEADRLAKLAR